MSSSSTSPTIEQDERDGSSPVEREVRQLVDKYGWELCQKAVERLKDLDGGVGQKLQRDENVFDVEQKINAAILDASFDAMFCIDSNGTIVTANQAAQKVFGYDLGEILGQNISLIVGEEHCQHHNKYIQRYLQTRETRIIGTQRQVSARRRDGSEFPCVLGIQVVELEKVHFVAYIRDVTDEQRAMQLEIEKKAAENLLLNMLPEEIALRLQQQDLDSHLLADHHPTATILFADIVGFTALSGRLTPDQVVSLLNDLFTRFDHLVDQYNLNKVKTIGDCYMVTSIPGKIDDRRACASVCRFALDMMDVLLTFNHEHIDEPLSLRIGINAGPVVAGVVGRKRFLYDLWGDAVNLASRMESTGIPGRIQVTREVVACVPEFQFEARGSVSVKGKGVMETFFLVGNDGNFGCNDV